MGWFDRLRGKADLQSQGPTPTQEAIPWPAGVPVTPENIAALSRYYHVIPAVSNPVNLEAFAQPIEDDADQDDWNPITDRQRQASHEYRTTELAEVRDLTENQPHCKRALALYVSYIFGADFNITLKPREDSEATEESKKLIKQVDRVWQSTLEANRKWWNPDEFCRRTYRDGEQFTRVFEGEDGLQFRFIDPELIKGPEPDDKSRGIKTVEGDVAQVEEYYIWDEELSKVVDKIPAEEVFHTKIDCDSSQKRGRSRFAGLIPFARMLQAFTRNEVIHRNLQSSIVLVRKVDGSANAARLMLDNARTGTTTYPEQTLNREKIRPGTILTTHRGIEVDFAQPKSDFSDASPLGAFLIQHIASHTGFTYSMLSSSPGGENHASALAAESPVVQTLMSERKFFAGEFHPIYRKTIEDAIKAGKIEGVSNSEEFWKKYDIDFRWGNIVTRDMAKEAQAVNTGVMMQAISRREASRRLGADPDQMRREIEEESEIPYLNANYANQNPTMDDKAASAAGNASAGGTNQGDKKPIEHKDKLS